MKNAETNFRQQFENQQNMLGTEFQKIQNMFKGLRTRPAEDPPLGGPAARARTAEEEGTTHAGGAATAASTAHAEKPAEEEKPLL